MDGKKQGMKNQFAKPPPTELERHPSYGTILYKNCKNCIQQIQCEYIRGIWKHVHNLYNCTKAEPIRNYSGQEQYHCKMHDFQPSKFSDAMICTKCYKTESKEDFLSNRNTYWCRIHDMKFANIEYHKKHYHDNGKIVMDYIDYTDTVKEYASTGKKLKNERKKMSDNQCLHYSDRIYLNKKDIDVSWIAQGVSKQKFMETILNSGYSRSGITWVKNRTTDGDSNDEHIYFTRENYGRIVLIRDGFGQKLKNKNDALIKVFEPVKKNK